MNEETKVALLAWREWFKERLDRAWFDESSEGYTSEEMNLWDASGWVGEQEDE